MALSKDEKIWKSKDDYITSKLDVLSKRIDRAQGDLLKRLVDDFIGRFDTDSAGNLKRTSKNIRLAKQLDRIFDEFDEQTIRKINTVWGEDMMRLNEMSGAYYNKGLDFPAKRIKSISEKVGFIEQAIGIVDGEIVSGSYLDDISKMPEVRTELKNYVSQSVASNKGYSEYLRGMRELVTGTAQAPGAVEKYYRQYAYDTFNNVDASINLHYAENLGLTWFIYQGSIIDTSRAFCIKRANKVYNTEETEKWKCDPTLIGKPKGKKCDDSYNPLIERGRYNCRHTIRYISDLQACDRGREEACDE